MKDFVKVVRLIAQERPLERTLSGVKAVFEQRSG